MSSRMLTASKQAYLIIAHQTNTAFKTLIQMLDHPQNNIFIHMDAKNKSYNPEEISKLVKFSKVFHTKRIKVAWAGFSMIKAELILLEAATSQGHYQHYHLLSGQDLPLKSQEEIINFFEAHDGVEFIHFSTKDFVKKAEFRWKYYHFFQDIFGRSFPRLFRRLHNLLFRIQRMLKVNRNPGINFKAGSQWFSITDELARYILSKRDWIRRTFNNTLCSDETCLQTIIANSEFRNKLFHKEEDDDLSGVMRLIDWKRGGPYTFTINELDEIRESKMLFARKFDPIKDEEIIIKIHELYCESLVQH